MPWLLNEEAKGLGKQAKREENNQGGQHNSRYEGGAPAEDGDEFGSDQATHRAAKRKRDDHQCKRYRPALDVRIFDRQRIGDGYECADTCTRNKPPDHELRHVRRQRGKGHAGRQQSQRAEERRVGTEGGRTGRSRWWPYNLKDNNTYKIEIELQRT